ncbi:MAG: methylmalonyl Co-A mutase-associated GTPase MeaB [Anaerolineales bacterium]
MGLVDRALDGDRLALARLVSEIEDETPAGDAALGELFPHTGRAHLVGVTGGSGTGKSTLVNQLALKIRSGQGNGNPKKVAIVAVDPSSPFSGGAILGDRIRMRDLAGDPGIFIRSMASRGALGGLARRTRSVVQLLDACGFDLILIETVGAGQSEVEIASTAYTTIVVDSPGLGDEVQAIKAGILEIADILVVNKADLPDAPKAVRALRMALELGYPKGAITRTQSGQTEPAAAPSTWSPPLLETIATQGEGISALLEAIDRHRDYLMASGEIEARRRGRVRAEMDQLLRDQLAVDFLSARGEEAYQQAVERVLARRLSPRQAVQGLIQGEVEGR